MVVKCLALILGLILVIGWLFAQPLRNLPSEGVGPIAFGLVAIAVGVAWFGCRRIVRNARLHPRG